MLIKDVIELAIIYLGLDELISTNVFTENGTAPTIAQQKEIDLLLRCANLVTEEIATDYIPLLEEKDITFSNGEIEFEDIDIHYLETISLSNQFGKLKFKERQGKLCADTTEAQITYRKYPTAMQISSEMENFNNKLNAKVLAFGIAMEHCFISTLSDEALIWEKRFKNGLMECARKNGNIILPKRRWF